VVYIKIGEKKTKTVNRLVQGLKPSDVSPLCFQNVCCQRICGRKLTAEGFDCQSRDKLDRWE